MNLSRILIASLLVVLLISGCAGKRAAKEEASQNAGAAASAPVDMTRPPTTIGAERQIVVESNPDETISFEEWKRRQAVDSQDRGDAPEGDE